jgi:ERCC4-related helicase
MGLLKENFEAREYQKAIAETAVKRNTLVVLPTGLGKTYVAILVVARRLENYPGSKALILAPTRPLVNQHKETFMKYLNLSEESFAAVTGKIHKEKRSNIYNVARIIFATPQLICNDLEGGSLNLSNYSILVVDESHRSVKRYPYPFIAKKYMEQSKFPLILSLTASPGGKYERIKNICENLFIEAVEIRTEKDLDVLPYVQPVKKEWVNVELPEDFKRIKMLFEEVLKENLQWLKGHGWIRTVRPTKKSLLQLQEELTNRYIEGEKNYSLLWAMERVIESVKVDHALELLETQGIFALKEYMEKIKSNKKMADRILFGDSRIREAFRLIQNLYSHGIDHPKLEKVKCVVKDLLKENPKARIIVFANYRSTIDRINELFRDSGIPSEILIGQAIKGGKGLKQEEQINILKRFNEGEFNVLIATSIGEEGLSITDVDAVIFFDNVASEIRRIQRYGRTGRTSPGKVIFFITKGTKDESYYWSSFQRERKMKSILYNMREKSIEIRSDKVRPRKTLLDWVGK